MLKMIKTLSDSNAIACEEDHDTYKDFANICKLKLQSEKLIVMKAQVKISKDVMYELGDDMMISCNVCFSTIIFYDLALMFLVLLTRVLVFVLLYQQLSGYYSINVRLQISIVLDRLRSNDNSLSSGHLAKRSGIEKDFIKNITTRFFKDFQTLLDFLINVYLSWQKHHCGSQSSFFGCRSTYCVNSVAVCGHRCKIRYMSPSFFGCLYDMRTLSECELRKFLEQFFLGDEYVLANAGYKTMNYIVPIKKKAKNSELSLADEEFTL
ncbi:hypothetical protein PHYBLDRAFT_61067 [Phycomyces blakesleeanus NRRL 1555(-)]|uniref:DDE Tnp4 domain-containing protein n=1 Tax=Phycomyces blakesleeanus (strain ATCC 8743b / DSM 1359 / FGSC 10004 / NBRC 33097 / NRRL 1555) TaxID=763407 RepID=A0A167N3L8_PHYB8|nr:hypothetical protein PHYBLDRAFT_61067 [Phycomyces blakesleeanus NRRL 1555(-)]OAD74889.1 hypothetical protein PHYBLDRAFT_61067 [Phycomyces blakesleeanus NRRL 1555(-)]|eukprot:XP_018292929.1 hypothetical protein PHYBLDRAFT_61067 [Phycomyces blakesleeanus NRRL 1555(-)]